jgi:phenylacetate-CoA ligase
MRRPVKWVTIGAENLQDSHREKIERAFGVIPRQHYGLAESVANASECMRGRLHIDEDFSHVELIPLENNEGLFRIIGTNWSNLAMPLLRYDTGDLASCDDTICDCGLKWRTINSIDGRLDDMITLPSGAKVGRLANIFKDFSEIREAQIHQSPRGNITLHIVPGNGFDSASTPKKLIHSATSKLGTNVPIGIKLVGSLPRTKAGKLRLVVVDKAE